MKRTGVRLQTLQLSLTMPSMASLQYAARKLGWEGQSAWVLTPGGTTMAGGRRLAVFIRVSRICFESSLQAERSIRNRSIAQWERGLPTVARRANLDVGRH